MTTTQRKAELTAQLLALWQQNFKMGYAGPSSRTVGMRSRLTRQFVEAEMLTGALAPKAWADAKECDCIARQQADEAHLLAKLGVAA